MSRVLLCCLGVAAIAGLPPGRAEAGLSPAGAAASIDIDAYIAAVRLARDGRQREALARFGALAPQHPNSVPVHIALARVALLAQEDQQVGAALRVRARLASGDIGAAVGLAELEAAAGNRGAAAGLLLEAIAAGARDPLLAPLVVASAEPAVAAAWFAARAPLVTDRAAFAALHARVLLQLGDVRVARAVLDGALAAAPHDAELLTLRASVLRAAGATDEACADAGRAARALVGERRVPSARVPARLALARANAACARVDEARRLLRTLGPLVTLPGDPPLAPAVRIVEAEVALAAEDPLGALRLLGERGADQASAPASDTGWEEARLAVRARAYALLGLPPPAAAALLARPLPAGLALADRSALLAAVALGGDRATAASAASEVALALDASGLSARAARARILARFLGADLPLRPEPTADVSAAVALLAAAHRSAAGTAGRGAPAVDLDETTANRGRPVAGLDGTTSEDAPVELVAALALRRAHAALAAGEPERARAAVRDGIRALDAARRAPVAPLAPELEPLAPSTAAAALELAGLSLRVAQAAGHPDVTAAADFLRGLERAVRGWSLGPSPWPSDPAEAARAVPDDACLVFAAAGEDAPALVLDERGTLEIVPLAAAIDARACDGVDAIYWAGPAAAPGGLAPAHDEQRRVLVRLARPTVVPRAVAPHAEVPRPVRIGNAGAGPLGTLVADLAAAPAVADGRRLARFDTVGWPVFAGTGLLPSTSPLSAGWLVPTGPLVPSGWLGPDGLARLDAPPGAGLVALGTRLLPGREPAERGAWVIAETALEAGWAWALLALEPLTREERRLVETRLPRWADDPVREARRLVRIDPALAVKLALWTVPTTEPPRSGAGMATAAGLALIALLAAALALRHVLARRALARRAPADNPEPPADALSPAAPSD